MSSETSESPTPALSPEQWPYLKEVIASHRTGKLGWGMMAEIDENGRLVIDVRGPTASALWNVEDRHALAALCLYQQPFGFTQEDVDDLREWAKWLDQEQQDTRLASVAHRIAALLPPK